MAQTTSTPVLPPNAAQESGNLAALLALVQSTVDTGAALLPEVLAQFESAVDDLAQGVAALRCLPGPQSQLIVSGTVTANAGAGLGTSALALEAGNLAALAALARSAFDAAASTLPDLLELAEAAVNDLGRAAGTLAAQAGVATAVLGNVSGSAASVQLLAANAARRMATFFNDSSASLYLKLGLTASTTSYTVLVQPYAYYELPLPVYTGRIDGLWSAAAGAVRITEM